MRNPNRNERVYVLKKRQFDHTNFNFFMQFNVLYFKLLLSEFLNWRLRDFFLVIVQKVQHQDSI